MACARGSLDTLLSLGGEPKEPDSVLATWFAERFVWQHADRAMAVLAGRPLHATLWNQIARVLSMPPRDADSAVAAKWVAVLVEH